MDTAGVFYAAEELVNVKECQENQKNLFLTADGRHSILKSCTPIGHLYLSVFRGLGVSLMYSCVFDLAFDAGERAPA